MAWPGAEYLDAHERGSNNDRMTPVDADRVHRVQVCDLVAALPGESDVTADAGYCATRFHATHDIPLRQLLILETDLWPSVNPDRRQPTPSPFRQRQATPRHAITPCFHTPSLYGSSNPYP